MKAYLLTLRGVELEDGKQAVGSVAITPERINDDLTPYVEALVRSVLEKEKRG